MPVVILSPLSSGEIIIAPASYAGPASLITFQQAMRNTFIALSTLSVYPALHEFRWLL